MCFRPDGLKKAYVRLAPDYDALDVANKVSLRDNVRKMCRHVQGATCGADMFWHVV